MKLLLLQTSARTNGNTSRVLALMDRNLKEEANRNRIALDTETIHLAKADIRMCRGCRACFDKGEEACPCKDDTLSVVRKMRDADAIVLASPVYVDDVNGVCKNWIDRLAFMCHRPEMAGKTAYLVATTGSTSASHTFRTMEIALMTWGFGLSGKAWFATGATMSTEEMTKRHSKRIGLEARKYVRDLAKKKWLKPSFVQLLIFRIQQEGWSKAESDTIDYAYWKEKSWLDKKHTTYFFRHNANPVKTLFARAIGAILSIFYV